MLTNFGKLSTEQILVWQRDVKTEFVRKSYVLRTLAGKGPNNAIEIIDTLKKTLGGGMEAMMTLRANLIKDGGVGSVGGKREGVEEQMKAYYQKITIDELFHSVRHEGSLAAQAEVVDFRKESKDALSDWLAERADQLTFLTWSGISYAYNLDGSTRAEDTFTKLNFASYVTAPTAKRHRRWNATTGTLVAGDTTAVVATDVPTVAMLRAMKAYAKSHKVKPIMAGGKEYYIVMMHPNALMQLKADPIYNTAIVTGGVRGDDNPFFTGGVVTVDGLVIQEHDLVYTTNGLVAGVGKWGAGSLINGCRTLLLGSQSLGFVDLEAPKWVEKGFEYDSQQGVYISKIFGLVKPKFYSTWDKSEEDFGVLAVDHYMPVY